jgi:hypothetical protein
MTSDVRQKQLRDKRRKNNRMLILVSVAHFLSWLPLNVVNIIFYACDTEEQPLFTNVEHMLIIYAICHLASMSSCITNPILYGYMNENFRAEFGKIWDKIKAAICSAAPGGGYEQPAIRPSFLSLDIVESHQPEVTNGTIVVHSGRRDSPGLINQECVV